MMLIWAGIQLLNFMEYTPIEKLMLELLLAHPEGVEHKVLAKIKQPTPKYLSNNVASHIKDLRKKLRKEGAEIVNMRGIGYKLIKGNSNH